jgi:hypothetical protein
LKSRRPLRTALCSAALLGAAIATAVPASAATTGPSDQQIIAQCNDERAPRNEPRNELIFGNPHGDFWNQIVMFHNLDISPYVWNKDYVCWIVNASSNSNAVQWTPPALSPATSNCGNTSADYKVSWSFTHQNGWQQVSGPVLPSAPGNLVRIVGGAPVNGTPGSGLYRVGTDSFAISSRIQAHLNPGEQAAVQYSVPLHTVSTVWSLYDKNPPTTGSADSMWMLLVPGYLPGVNADAISRAIDSISGARPAAKAPKRTRPAVYSASPVTYTGVATDEAPKLQLVTSKMTPQEYLKACGKPMPEAPGGPDVTAALVPPPPVTLPTTGSTSTASPTPGAGAAPLAPVGPPAAQAPSAVVTITPSTVGGPVDSYTVTSHPDDKTCVAAGGTQPQSCVVTGLRNGTSYDFTAVATNAGGTAGSAPSNSVTTPSP